MGQYPHVLLLCLVLACHGMACTLKPKMVGPTVPSGYLFSVQVSDSTIQVSEPFSDSTISKLPASAELTVRVQNAQGQPVDGVPAEFQVEPAWSGSVSPQRAITSGGTARAVFQAQSDGRAYVRVRGAPVPTDLWRA